MNPTPAPSLPDAPVDPAAPTRPLFQVVEAAVAEVEAPPVIPTVDAGPLQVISVEKSEKPRKVRMTPKPTRRAAPKAPRARKTSASPDSSVSVAPPVLALPVSTSDLSPELPSSEVSGTPAPAAPVPAVSEVQPDLNPRALSLLNTTTPLLMNIATGGARVVLPSWAILLMIALSLCFVTQIGGIVLADHFGAAVPASLAFVMALAQYAFIAVAIFYAGVGVLRSFRVEAQAEERPLVSTEVTPASDDLGKSTGVIEAPLKAANSEVPTEPSAAR